MPDLELSFATQDDSADIFAWRNDEVTRSMFFNQDKVAWAEHEKWFKDSLQNPMRLLLIAQYAQEKAGIVRFDLDESVAQISLNINPALRGKKLASPLLLEAQKHLPPHIKTLRANIKMHNKASIKSFENSGYSLKENHGNTLLFEKNIGRTE